MTLFPFSSRSQRLFHRGHRLQTACHFPLSVPRADLLLHDELCDVRTSFSSRSPSSVDSQQAERHAPKVVFRGVLRGGRAMLLWRPWGEGPTGYATSKSRGEKALKNEHKRQKCGYLRENSLFADVGRSGSKGSHMGQS